MKPFEMAQLQEFAAKYAAPQSHASVVGDPVDSGSRYVIDSIYVGGDADGTLQIEDTTPTAVAGYFFPFSASRPTQVDGKFLKGLPKGKGIKITTTGGGNHAVVIKYDLRADGAP